MTEESIHSGHRERLRLRYLESGLDSFDDHTALELLLYYAIPRADTNELSHRLIDAFGSLNGVLSASQEELRKVKGVGERAAALITLVRDMARKSAISKAAARRVTLNSSELAGDFLLPYFMGQRDEIVYLLTLDNKCRLIRARRFSSGGLTSADVSVRNIVECAIKDSASAVILAHNHPSGVALPSRSDIYATEEIVKAMTVMDIRVLDHIIVAEDDYVSMARSNVPCLKGY